MFKYWQLAFILVGYGLKELGSILVVCEFVTGHFAKHAKTYLVLHIWDLSQ